MEIKTCEQYVLDRLMTLEGENEELQYKLEQTQDKYNSISDKYFKMLELFKGLSEVKTAGSGTKYISFDSVWESFDIEKYEAVRDMLYSEEWEI